MGYIVWRVSVPFALLGLLEREPSYGYELKLEYDSHLGRGRPVPFGQVYQTLGRLARDGKVTAGHAEPGAGPDRKRYTITTQGVEDFERWLATPVMPEPHLQTELFMKVVLAILVGRSAKAYLDSQRAAHLTRIRELTKTKRSATLIDTLLVDHALFRVEADLRWIDLTEARLDALAQELTQ
jgi:DNA-binding PadR family transcriptional regulator